jgi:hypothetical protein
MSIKSNVNTIVSYLQGLGYSTESIIALLCNIAVESASTYSPFIIQSGYTAPFQTSGGYGLVQFSNYPQNENIRQASIKLSENDAIKYQLDIINTGQSWYTSVLYPSFNLSFREFRTNSRNWSVSQLTYAFMRQYERPSDQTQDRYTSRVNEVKGLYDFSKLPNGVQDVNTDESKGKTGYDYPPFAFDCGGHPIVFIPDTPPPPSPSPTPTTNTGTNVTKVMDSLISDMGKGFNTDGAYGVQCVDLCLEFIKRLCGRYISILGNANTQGNAFWSLSQANKFTPYKKDSWTKVSANNVRNGDLLWWGYSSYGHIGIAISSTQFIDQNGGGHNEGITKRNFSGAFSKNNAYMIIRCIK